MNTATQQTGPEVAGQNQTKTAPTEISGSPVFLNRIAGALTNAEAEVKHKPTAKLRKGDVVLGVLTNPGLRGLFSLGVELENEARALASVKLPLKPSSRIAAHESYHARAQEAAYVKDIFGKSLRDLLGDNGYGDVQVLEDWTVVLRSHEHEAPEGAQAYMGKMVEALAEQLSQNGFPVFVQVVRPSEHADEPSAHGPRFSTNGERGRGQ